MNTVISIAEYLKQPPDKRPEISWKGQKITNIYRDPAYPNEERYVVRTETIGYGSMKPDRLLHTISWLDTEIQALRLNFLNDEILAAATPAQLQALNSLIGQGLTDHRKELRIRILREITGIPQLTSSTQLTAGVVSVLITYLKEKEQENWDLNETAKRFLKEAAARCVEGLPPRKERKSTKSKVEENGQGVAGDSEVWVTTPEGWNSETTGGSMEETVGHNSEGNARVVGDCTPPEQAQEPANGEQRGTYSTGLAALLSNLRKTNRERRYARGSFDSW